MAYDEKLTARIRELLAESTDVEEKKMFSGVCFMVNEKMCVCSTKDGLLCRIGEASMEAALVKGGCIQMVMKGKAMKDYVIVEHEALKSKRNLDYWINLSLAFNREAKASKKRSATKKV